MRSSQRLQAESLTGDGCPARSLVTGWDWSSSGGSASASGPSRAISVSQLAARSVRHRAAGRCGGLRLSRGRSVS
jgi:hypothetical protein